MSRSRLDHRLLPIVAGQFKVLAEPARLAILNVLRDGELTVTELAEQTGLGQANLSKHLQLLHAHGFVTRRKEGNFTYYDVASRDVYRLCDIMCSRVGSVSEARARLAGGRA